LGVGTYGPREEDRSWPCLIGNTCNDTLVDNQNLCENDNGGTWYGPGGKKKLNSCCAVQRYLGTSISLAPIYQYTMRGGVFNGTVGAFKLVEMQGLDCSKPIAESSPKAFPWQQYELGTKVEEFYDLTLNPNSLDNANDNLAQNCAPGQDLTTCLPTQIDVDNYTQLANALQRMKNSAKDQNRCQGKGDGNGDLRVNKLDLDGWAKFNGKGPSRYDVNLDGKTDKKDQKIIKANMGLDCMDTCTRADLNRDGVVDSADMTVLNSQRGVCTDPTFCGGDLNGDGVVNSADVKLMNNATATCN
jgi:hypothetical protein